MTVDKTTLTERVLARHNAKNKLQLTPAQTAAVLNAILEEIQATVAAGDRVNITGFGAFEARGRAERQGTNPQTREVITIPATTTVGFKAGESFRARVKASA